MPTLVDLLRGRALEHPEKWIYRFLSDGEREEGLVTLADLDQRAREIAARLQQQNIHGQNIHGQRALLLFPPGLDFIATFFGCLYAGVVAVPAYPPRGRRDQPALRSIALDARICLVLTTRAQISRVDAWRMRILELRAARPDGVELLATDSSEIHTSADDWRPPSLHDASLAFLQYTSGSTSAPKGVKVTHANLLHNEQAIERTFRQQGGRTVVSWLPLHHDMGLIGGVLQPLYSGGQAVLMSPMSFLQRPVRWLRAIDRYQAHTSGGPNFAYDLCVEKVSEEHREGLDLSSWRVAFNGAEPVRHATLERFSRRFADQGFQKRAFVPCFGLAEATLLVSGGHDADRDPAVKQVSARDLEQGRILAPKSGRTGRSLVSSGLVAEGLDVRIVDPETRRPCPPDQVGEIWVAGPSRAEGYWDRLGLTGEVFEATVSGEDVSGEDVSGEDVPFLRTGDLGFLTPEGLYVTGRIKDLIILRGRNVYPQDLELTIDTSHEDLVPRANAAFAVSGDHGEMLVVVCEMRRRPKSTLDEIHRAVRRTLAEQHEVLAHEVVLIRFGTLPRTTSGKVRRRACAAAYRAGELTVVDADNVDADNVDADNVDATAPRSFRRLSREELLSTNLADRRPRLEEDLRHRAALLTQTDPRELDGHETLPGLGFDSLKAAELRGELEADLGLAPSWDQLLSETTLAQLASALLDAWTDEAADSAVGQAVSADSSADPPTESALSQGQKALWYLHRLDPGSAAYNLTFAARLRRFEAPALEQVVCGWTERHSALLATFPLRDTGPVQRSEPNTRLEFHHTDAASWSTNKLEERLEQEAHRPFDLTRDLLVRVHLFRRPDAESVLLLVAHHIVLDLQSLFLLLSELAEGEGRTGQLQYTDYVHWQEENLTAEAGRELERSWLRQLAGFRPHLELFTDHPRTPAPNDSCGSLPVHLDPSLTADLESWARARSATLYTVLLSGLQALLHRYTGQTDLAVGTPFAARTRPEWTRLVGYLTNALPIRGDLAGNPSCEMLTRRLGRSVLHALVHQDYPASLLVDKLHLPRDAGRNPLFEVMLAVEKIQRLDGDALASFLLGRGGARLALGEFELESIALNPRAAQFDLTVRWIAQGPELIGQWIYRTDLFDPVTIGRMARHYRELLATFVRDPSRRLSELELVSAAERQQMVVEWNDTRSSNKARPGLHELAFRGGALALESTALEFEGAWLSHGELRKRSRLWARRLQEAGVAPEVRVGLHLERGLDMVVSLLAVLEAGGAYVPLDPSYPADRLAFMTEDAGIGVLVTRGDLLPRLAYQGNVIHMDGAMPRLGSGGSTHGVPAGQLAYVIYTSGTTGRPKGVMIRHDSAAHFLRSMARRPGFERDEVLLAVTTLSFDIALLELLLPLTRGARVELISSGAASDARRLNQRLLQSRSPVLQATPATWRMLLESGFVPPQTLRVLTGGEPLPSDLAHRLSPHGKPIWNLYGPTETTVWSAVEAVGPEAGPVTIGRPIDATEIHLAARRLEVVPLGAAGELLIGGGGLARGYLARPGLTAEKLIPDPWSGQSGARLYKTGDLARRRTDGRLECLGRVDHQVKLRGFRIELGEIEARLREADNVEDAVVGLREDVPGRRRLVGYLVLVNEEQHDSDSLRRHLSLNLPSYMVPAVYVTTAGLPRTPSGKIDRAALQRLAIGVPEEAGTEPETETEKMLAQIWTEVLALGGSEISVSIGLGANFFELGGDSISSVQVITRAADFGLKLTPRLFLEHPTLRELAKATEELDPPQANAEDAWSASGESADQLTRDGPDLSDIDLDPDDLDLILRKFSD